MLQTVIHDWDDEPSVRILQTCRRSMGEGAKLLVVEQVLPTGNEYHSSKFDDLNMLVLYRGRERTAEEFRRLLITAGFTLPGSCRHRLSGTCSKLCPCRAPPDPRLEDTGVASAPE